MPELKSTVKSKPNARVSLPDNRRIKKGGNIQFLPFPLSLSHLAQFRSAGFLLRIWASTDGSKPFCLFNNCENYVWVNWGCFLVSCFSALWGQWMEPLESMHKERKNMRLQKRNWNTGPRNHTASVSKG